MLFTWCEKGWKGGRAGAKRWELPGDSKQKKTQAGKKGTKKNTKTTRKTPCVVRGDKGVCRGKKGKQRPFQHYRTRHKKGNQRRKATFYSTKGAEGENTGKGDEYAAWKAGPDQRTWKREKDKQ